MECTTTSWSVARLAKETRHKNLHRRDEYQRGETWTDVQKQRFVDSLFRGYPVPAIFLHVVHEPQPLTPENSNEKLYIIDGQQRLSALRSYIEEDLEIPDLTPKSKLRLPDAISKQPCGWTGKCFREIDKDLQIALLNREIPVHQIRTDSNAEVRDLFIRLQSGTALLPQQVRDAWPGSLAPFVERFGGKFAKSPHRLFTLIDKRGEKSPQDDTAERRDQHVASRQLCAQLLELFLGAREGAGRIPSVGAKQLDEMYYIHAGFPDDQRTQLGEDFASLLDMTATIVQVALQHSCKNTLPKLEVFSAFLLLERLQRQPGYVPEQRLYRTVGKFCSEYPERETSGKRTSARTISVYFRNWARCLRQETGLPELDSIGDIAPEDEDRKRNRGIDFDLGGFEDDF